MSGRPSGGRAAVGAAVALALLATLPLVWAAVIIYALSGLSPDSEGGAWALLPLTCALALVVGAVQLARRRSWLVLAVAASASAAVVAWSLVDAAADGNTIAWAMAALLVGLLATAALSGSPAVRDRVAGRQSSTDPPR